MKPVRSVQITGFGFFAPSQSGAVDAFRARDYIADRKSLKLMTTSVRLGVAAIRMALDDDGDLTDIPPHRRGLFVGTSPQPGDPTDLGPALAASLDDEGRFDLQRFARAGYPLIHPLWLVRGLSNNIIGFASAIHDLQGVNMNYCHGIDGGWTALHEGAFAVAEGRADLVVAGGADACLAATTLVGEPCGDGAAFFVIRPGEPDCLPSLRHEGLEKFRAPCFIGAATWPIALAQQFQAARLDQKTSL